LKSRMHLELLVEEPSAEAALTLLLPRIAPECTFRIHPHSGKVDLLASLPAKLNGYAAILRQHPDWRVVVLVDEDREDCLKLKRRIVDLVRGSGSSLRSRTLARIAVEELESWFLGDVPALVRAYPKVSLNLSRRRGFRDPDKVAGGTWEALERVLQQAGYYRGGGLPKIETARRISEHMDIERNESLSFCIFRNGIRELAREVTG
jgi:hypothetical protein